MFFWAAFIAGCSCKSKSYLKSSDCIKESNLYTPRGTKIFKPDPQPIPSQPDRRLPKPVIL